MTNSPPFPWQVKALRVMLHIAVLLDTLLMTLMLMTFILTLTPTQGDWKHGVCATWAPSW